MYTLSMDPGQREDIHAVEEAGMSSSLEAQRLHSTKLILRQIAGKSQRQRLCQYR